MQRAAHSPDEEKNYESRSVTNTLLYRTIQENLQTFLQTAERSERRFPVHVHCELEQYLRCGVAANGFVRLKCPNCKLEKQVPFSCKKRGFCPSCGGRRMNQMAAHLNDNVFPNVPVRQWVLSFPMQVRYMLSYNPKLTTKVLRIYIKTISKYYQRKAIQSELKETKTGGVTFIQRFGSALNLNVHFHTLFMDGVFKNHKFQSINSPTNKAIARITQEIEEKVNKLLETEQLINSEELNNDPIQNFLLKECNSASIQNRVAFGERARRRVRKIGHPVGIGNVFILGRRNAISNGYSLHANTRIRKNDRKGLEKLCRYVARPPIATERLKERNDKKLTYKLKRPFSDGTTHILFDPVELIEKIVALIPPPRANLLRYHGLLSPNSKSRATIVPKPKTQEQSQPNHKRYSWANLLKRVFKVDVLKCPNCNSKMRIVSKLMDRNVTKPFLEAVKMPSEPPTQAPARGPPQMSFDEVFNQDIYPTE